MLISGMFSVPQTQKVTVMATMTFKWKDATDIRQQAWAWRSANPNCVVTKEYPIETLALDMSQPADKFAKKLEGADLVSMRIDYED
jgi:hypothetical protein